VNPEQASKDEMRVPTRR